MKYLGNAFIKYLLIGILISFTMHFLNNIAITYIFDGMLDDYIYRLHFLWLTIFGILLLFIRDLFKLNFINKMIYIISKYGVQFSALLIGAFIEIFLFQQYYLNKNVLIDNYEFIVTFTIVNIICIIFSVVLYIKSINYKV